MIDKISWFINASPVPMVCHDADTILMANSAYSALTAISDFKKIDFKKWLTDTIKAGKNLNDLILAMADGSDVSVDVEAKTRGVLRNWLIVSKVTPGEFFRNGRLTSFQDVSIVQTKKAYWDLHVRMSMATTLLEKEIRVRREAEKKLNEMQQAMLVNAHQAGMSEIATGVLHNVGNVLNSANVGLEIIIQSIDKSEISSLYKANGLLKKNRSRLADFLTKDPKGEKLIDFYLELGEAMKSEFQGLKIESRGLMEKLQLIKGIVNSQQEYAKGRAEFKESVSLVELAESALLMQANALARHEIKVIKKFSEPSAVLVQKTKFMHVLLNLIKNAKEAMDTRECTEKVLTLEIGQINERNIFLKMSDTGQGISKENLSKVFNHGFTTKKTGHGFGLHFCANAATEMDAKISVSSEGLGHGSSFTIIFDGGHGPR